MRGGYDRVYRGTKRSNNASPHMLLLYKIMPFYQGGSLFIMYNMNQFSQKKLFLSSVLKFFKAEPEENELSSQPRKSSNLNEETIRAMASAVTLALKPMVNQNEMSPNNTNQHKNG